jgi:hypothetical protein
VQIAPTSPCVDKADGDAAYLTDILNNTRVDFAGTSNGNHGSPGYVDMGAYEGPEYFVMLMCWIDESSLYDDNETIYNDHLDAYKDSLEDAMEKRVAVKALCFVPSSELKPHPISDVLPEGYSAPDEITIENCTRFPSNEVIKNEFNEHRGDIVPDYLICSVDDSGSMIYDNMWEDTSEFTAFSALIQQQSGCSNVDVHGSDIAARRFPPFENGPRYEQWVAEMNDMLLDLLDSL